MKLKIAFALSLLSVASLAGNTGSQAAGGITSNPDTKSTVEGTFSISMIGYNYTTEENTTDTINVNKDMTWNDIDSLVNTYGMSLSSVAANALMALAKAAYAEGLAEYNTLRIKKLEETTKNAFKALDKIDLVDEVSSIRKTLNKQQKADDGTSGNTYFGQNIFNVAGAQADGKSIASNEYDKLCLKNFPNIPQDTGKIPFFSMVGQNPVLNWYAPKDDIDGESIVADVASGYPNQIVNAGDKHGIHLAGWYKPEDGTAACGESLATQLKEGHTTHYVLTKHKNLNALHYTEVGQLTGGGCAFKFSSTTADAGQEIVVGESSVTNTVTFGSASDSNVRVTVGGTSGKNGHVSITFGVYYR